MTRATWKIAVKLHHSQVFRVGGWSGRCAVLFLSLAYNLVVPLELSQVDRRYWKKLIQSKYPDLHVSGIRYAQSVYIWRFDVSTKHSQVGGYRIANQNCRVQIWIEAINNEIASRYVRKHPGQVLGWTLEAGHYHKRLLPLHRSTPERIYVSLFLLRN